ncbi:hypothetical protein ALT721_410028 [Alteromonas alvinellae]
MLWLTIPAKQWHLRVTYHSALTINKINSQDIAFYWCRRFTG